ncbi:MAG TPA: D-alanyl-D-alanine carboxypeptidase/D-alanyl-D-alanine-endopeptidase [Kofleriaceae bacterium]|nr:D-alanyl-D-alanine carboxypeptidase/D-alanyl-D-alanine-endopeptidase [Kofleriaceae bacterium]
MVTSRAFCVFALLSIGTSVAYSQGSGSDTGSDEEESGTGSGSALVAPRDPKARSHWLREKLDGALAAHPQVGKAKITAYVVEVESGNALYQHEPDAAMNLASNAKLLTSVAALGTLGGGFRWRTAVYADDLDEATGDVKGNLYVRGRGDPTLTDADPRQLAADVAARGVRDIKGSLVIDGTYFDGDTEPPHFADQPKERAGYRAPVASFGVDKSAMTVNVIAEPGGNAKMWLSPDAGDYLRLMKAEATSDPLKPTRLKVDVKPKADHLEVDIAGTIRPSDGSFDRHYRVDDPQRFAAKVMLRALTDAGIHITKVATGTVPPTAKVIAVHDSAPLALVIREMNKQSDNYVAETLLKTLGAETRTTPGPATWADGIAARDRFLSGLGVTGYRADNGSGLYAATDVSAKQLVTLLRAAHRDYRIGPDLVASLPTGGVDGTLAKRWHGRAAAGRVRAKTGTLDKVTTLAGYVAVDGGHELAFAILANDIPAGQRNTARAIADDMVDALVAYLEAAAR